MAETTISDLSHAGSMDRPLCVDLDGTLVSTDTLQEAVVLLLRRQPWTILFLPFWLLRGRAGFKRAISERVSLKAAALPYRRDLVDFLQAGADAGRRVVLATAADRDIADAVAKHLGLFDEVLASDGQHNLKGKNKLEQLRSRYESTGFDYVGDSAADLPLWEAAEQGYVVGADHGVASRAEKVGARVLSRRPSILAAMIKELRPHQWAKNALVFLPVLLVPGLPDLAKLWTAALATGAFSLVASAGYVFNDLLDLEADRAHHSKYRRPFASGDLPVGFGPPLFAGLIVVAAIVCLWLPVTFAWMLGAYFVATLSYSFYFKSKLMIDVLLLAGLYTHRILAGGIAANIPISAWLLAFSMFFFLSLAFAKRYVELLAKKGEGGQLMSRGYRQADTELVSTMGAAAGYMAVLVFSFYIDSDAVRVGYREPAVLWLICPVLLYWISRIWFLTHRGEMQDDPVKFALKDRVSLASGVIIVAIAAVARFMPFELALFAG